MPAVELQGQMYHRTRGLLPELTRLRLQWRPPRQAILTQDQRVEGDAHRDPVLLIHRGVSPPSSALSLLQMAPRDQAIADGEVEVGVLP